MTDQPATPDPAADSAATRHHKRELQGAQKLAVDFGPLLVFFLANAKFGIFAGTAAFMAATALAIAFAWARTRHIPPMLMVTGVVVLVFGGLTVVLKNDVFIKLKPTIVNTLFGLVLLVGQRFDKPVLKTLFASAFPPLTDAGWAVLTRNWGLFFLALAVLNEVVWRNFSTDFWVAFKVWGAIPITVVFALSQTPVMMKHMIEEPKDPR